MKLEMSTEIGTESSFGIKYNFTTGWKEIHLFQQGAGQKLGTRLIAKFVYSRPVAEIFCWKWWKCTRESVKVAKVWKRWKCICESVKVMKEVDSIIFLFPPDQLLLKVVACIPEVEAKESLAKTRKWSAEKNVDKLLRHFHVLPECHWNSLSGSDIKQSLREMCCLNNYLRTKFELNVWETHFKTETKRVSSSYIFTQTSGKDHNDDNGDNDHDDISIFR